MSISLKMKGRKRLVSTLNELTDNARLAVELRITELGLSIHSIAIKSIQSVSTGKEIRNKRGKRHIVSRKGDAPNTDEGALVRDMFFRINKQNLTGEVGNRSVYAAYLEFGVDRPYLKPAMRKALIKLNSSEFKVAIPKKGKT